MIKDIRILENMNGTHQMQMLRVYEDGKEKWVDVQIYPYGSWDRLASEVVVHTDQTKRSSF